MRGRRRRKLLDDLKEKRGYSHLKEEALDRTMWRARFGRGFGPVVKQTAKWMNEWIRPWRSREGREVQLYSFFKFCARWGGWSKPHPGRITPVKETQCKRLGGPEGWSGQVWKVSPLQGIDPHTVQFATSRYSKDYPNPAHLSSMCMNMNYARSENVCSKQSTSTWTSQPVPLADWFWESFWCSFWVSCKALAKANPYL
jgi:hypothetical protein